MFRDLGREVLEVFADAASWAHVEERYFVNTCRIYARRAQQKRESNARWRAKTPKEVKKALRRAEYLRNRTKRLASSNAYNARTR